MIWAAAGLLVAILWWWTADEIPVPSQHIAPSTVSAVNLRGILQAWALRQYDGDKPTRFSKTLIEDDLDRSYSATNQYWIGRVKVAFTYWYSSGYVMLHLGALSVLLILVVLLGEGTARKIASVVVLLLAFILTDSILGGPMLERALPGSLGYFDDYVFLDDADSMSSNPLRDSTVVAYERVPSGPRRIVGFGSGYAKGLSDSELIPILESQGDKLVSDAVPTSLP